MDQKNLIQSKYLNYYAQYTEPMINNLLNQLPDLKYFKFMREQTKQAMQSYDTFQIDRLYNDTETEWINVYRSIKDASWPECYSYKDFSLLPGHIQEECTIIHKVSPAHWTEHLRQSLYTTSALPIQNIVRLKHIVLDNLEYIRDKNIIDFACNTGSNSISCMFNGAASVLGTEVRKENAQVASIVGKHLGYTEDKFLIQTVDIHDYTLNTSLCQGKNTVLLCGIMYHVHDHYNILESIANARPNHIIIESGDHPLAENLDAPTIIWEVESSDRPDGRLHNGYYQNQKDFLIGTPNDAWFNLTLEHFGYKKIKLNKFLFCTDHYVKNDLRHVRSVYVYERIK